MNLYCEKVLDPEKNEYTVYANPGNGVEGVWKLAPVGITSTPDKNQATTKAIAEPLKTGEPGDLTGEQYSMWEYCYKALLRAMTPAGDGLAYSVKRAARVSC